MPNFDMPAEDRKPRNVFPLPVCHSFRRQARTGLSRSCARRLLRANAKEWEFNNTVCCLNALYSGGDILSDRQDYAFDLNGSSLAQKRALEFVSQSVHEMGSPPDDLSGPGALELLRATGVYGADQIPSTLGSYNPEMLSLPEVGNQPVALEDLWGKNGQQFVGTFIHNVTLPENEAKSRIKATGLRQCYSDPLLRDRKTFANLVSRLHACGLVTYSRQPSKCFAELFFVKKKSGQLRMVVDCRHSNQWFREPIGVSLATGDALSRIEVQPHERLHFASADLKDAFYHLGLPEPLRPLFGLRAVKACDVGVTEIGGKGVQWHETLYPQLCVVPMGFSWALYLCQTVHERIVGQVGAEDTSRLSDKKPAPSSQCMHTEYVDNFHVIGTDPEQVSQLSLKGIHALRSSGLVVHEEEQSTDSAHILGWEFGENGSLRPSKRRLWKVRLGILQVLKTGQISGQQLERVVGHMSFISMVRREGLSILGDVYSFIKKHYFTPARLWKSVRRELSIWYGISPLLWKELNSQWSETIYATDASDWGSGATIATMPHNEVQELGRYAERWRFKDERWRFPRKSATGIFSGEESDEVVSHSWRGDSSLDCGNLPDSSSVVFKPLPFSAVDRPWKVVGRWKWKRQESIPILEARATLFAVKHMARSSSSFGKKHLIFSDSMTAVASISRGRAHARGLRRVVQQISALCLCSRISIHTRWCASEWNPADGPSRGKYTASEPFFEFHSDGVAQNIVRGGEGYDRAHLETIQEEEECSDRTVFFSADKVRHPPAGSAHEKTKSGSKQSSDGPNNIAAGCSQDSHQAEVSQTLGRVLPVVQLEQVQDKHERGNGPCLDHVSGRGISRWGGPQSWSLHCGRSDFCETRTEKPFNAKVATDKTKSSGVAQFDASPVPSSNSLGGDVFGCSFGFQDEVETTGGRSPDGLLHVFEAIRTLPNQGERCCASQCKVETQAPELGSDLAQLRRRSSIQDSRVRREGGVGLGASAVSGGDGENYHSGKQADWRPSSLQSGSSSDQNLPSDCPGKAQHHGDWSPSSIPSKTWRCKHGLLGEAQIHSRNSEKRRWRATASVRRYEKGGRLSQLLNSLPSHTQELATWASENIEQAFYNPRLLTNIP